MNKKDRKRFEAKISKVPTSTGCLEWQGGCDKNGYGYFYSVVKGKGRAHRVAYEIHHNVKLTSDQYVTHTCDNRTCVNVQHLKLGTPQTNADDKVRRGRSQGPLGSKNGMAKLTEEQVKTMRLLYSSGKFSYSALGRFFEITSMACSKIVRGVLWKHVKTPKISNKELDTLVAEYVARGLKQKRQIWDGQL